MTKNRFSDLSTSSDEPRRQELFLVNSIEIFASRSILLLAFRSRRPNDDDQRRTIITTVKLDNQADCLKVPSVFPPRSEHLFGIWTETVNAYVHHQLQLVPRAPHRHWISFAWWLCSSVWLKEKKMKSSSIERMGQREFLGDALGYLTRWKANIVIQLAMMNHWMQYAAIVNEFPLLSCPSARITSLSIVCITEQSSWKWIYFSWKECPFSLSVARARVTLTTNSTLHVHQLARNLYFHDPIARIVHLIKQQWTWGNVRSSCLHSLSWC